jgi:ADP-ribose pyrophosphatase
VAPEIGDRGVAFATPWFQVVAKTLVGGDPDAPFYSIKTDDYVSITALTDKGDYLLVRQYRPAPERYTLELPSGHVDPGETPEAAARRELIEETGYRPARVEHIGTLLPDTGRMGNRIWCFFADGATREGAVAEAGVELVVLDRAALTRAVLGGEFDHALHLAALFLAASKGKIAPFGA